MPRITSRANTNVLLSTKSLKKHSILEKDHYLFFYAIILGNYHGILWLASCRRLYTLPWHELIDLGIVPLLMCTLPWALRQYASQFAVTVSFYLKKKGYLITWFTSGKDEASSFFSTRFLYSYCQEHLSAATQKTL